MCPRSKIQEFRYYWIKYEATTYLQNCAAGLENESLCERCLFEGEGKRVESHFNHRTNERGAFQLLLPAHFLMR